MIGYSEAPRAWGLTRGMARLVGVNLTGAVIEGWLSRAELAGLVQRCLDCPNGAACTQFLAQRAEAQSLPDFCANKRDLEALMPRS